MPTAKELYQQDVNRALDEGFASTFPYVQFTAMNYRRTALRYFVTAFEDLPEKVRRRYERRAE